eukprot:scaffold31966_cov56-Phaeocystis_antarctica.AAC.1
MDLNSSEDEDEPLPETRVTEGVRVARTTRTGSTHITSDLVALPNPRPRSECSSAEEGSRRSRACSVRRSAARAGRYQVVSGNHQRHSRRWCLRRGLRRWRLRDA